MDFSFENVRQRLDQCGFKARVAGDELFNRVAKGIALAHEHGRGILFSGACGTGKSCAAKAIQKMMGADKFRYYDCGTPRVNILLNLEINEYAHDALSEAVIIDDFGAEPTFTDYGVKREIVGEFISARYAQQEIMRGFKKAYPFHVLTTNLSANDIAGRYGQRLVSRISDFYVICKFSGADHRKPIAV